MIVMTLFAAVHLSASGTKQTSAGALQMSLLGGKADMTFCDANAAFDAKRTIRSFASL
jgi:hypothetical protein